MYHRRKYRRRYQCLVGAIIGLLVCVRLQAADASFKAVFSLPADTAERSLKGFSEQSGRSVVFVTAAVKGVRTNNVEGMLTPHEALAKLLRGTGLICSLDVKSGAFVVRKADSKVEKPSGAERRK